MSSENVPLAVLKKDGNEIRLTRFEFKGPGISVCAGCDGFDILVPIVLSAKDEPSIGGGV